MKILLLAKSTTAHGFGGMETHVESVARSARELGHEVTVITTAHPRGLPQEVRDGVRIEYLSGTPPAVYSGAWWGKSVEAVRQQLTGGFGDLLLSVSLAGYGVAAAGVRVPHYAFAYGDILGNVINEWHNCQGLRGRAAYPKHALATLYLGFLERRFWSRLDGVIATYDALYERLRRLGYRAFLSYNGIDVGRFAPDDRLRQSTRQALGIPGDARALLMVTTVNRQKGVWLGVGSFGALAARYPDLHLLVVGDGPDLPRLRRTTEAAPASRRVRFAGAISLDAVPAFYAAGDIFLYPTLRREGLPLAVAEALAAGLPVVASDRGGITSAVKDGATGLLVRPGDGNALTRAVERLLEDPVLTRSLGKGAREWAWASVDAKSLTARLLGELTESGSG